MSFTAIADPSEPVAYAIQLTAATSNTATATAVTLRYWFHVGGSGDSNRILAVSSRTDVTVLCISLHRSGFTVAEVEPLGVYQFSPDSRQMVIAEDIQTITLYVQRLYGSRSNRTRLSYSTTPASAAAGEDFTGVPDGVLVFDSPRQTNASFQLSILDDSRSEPDEYFHVNLTDVQTLSPDSPRTDAPPRLNPQHSVATVTILASDVTGGVLSIGPGLVQTPEDRDEETQQERRVVLRVRRSDGVAGSVRVRVQAYGGGCLFCCTTLITYLLKPSSQFLFGSPEDT